MKVTEVKKESWSQQKARRDAELKQVGTADPEPTAKDLKQGLSGTISEREVEDRSIILTMCHGEKPEVAFNGFWNGRLVKNAMNAISRGYRLRRHKQVRSNAATPNPPAGGEKKEG